MPKTFALITPSFAPDFERCELLSESIHRHVAGHVDHYIVVDRSDEKLFSRLKSSRTHLVIKQDVLPWWLRQVPVSRKWWFNLTGRPVRGWIVQQITKLSVPKVSTADVLLFVDSDTLFVRPYDPRDSIRDGKVPMFRELLADDGDAHNNEWHSVARATLGLAEQAKSRTNYVTQLVPWRRENVLKLYEHIEKRTGRPWPESILKARTFSEYVLYGTFCEHVLGEQSGQYHESRIDSLNYWGTERLDEAKLGDLKAQLKPEHVAIMVSAKSHTPVASIRRAFW